jgi:uncharacterized glyoxalase superfamily protein PhnB
MASRLNPYLNFPGTTRQAMELYASVFGGELTVMTFADAGAEGMTMPLERQMWGDDFGACTDRFGVSWMVNIAGDAA